MNVLLHSGVRGLGATCSDLLAQTGGGYLCTDDAELGPILTKVGGTPAVITVSGTSSSNVCSPGDAGCGTVTSSTSSWLVPVAIGLGVLLLIKAFE